MQLKSHFYRLIDINSFQASLTKLTSIMTDNEIDFWGEIDWELGMTHEIL